MTDPTRKFEDERRTRLAGYAEDAQLQESARDFLLTTLDRQYSYNFSWMGRPIIQYPQDMIAMQEIIWQTKPDLIIECGIAHGGSLIFYASLLELIGKGEILGIDVDIRAHNRAAIESHPMAKRIHMIEGSSIAPDTIAKVRKAAADKKTIMVCLDSNHTHDHVLAELEAYAPLVTHGSYCVVFDTVIERMTKGSFPNRPWDVGNNPMTAMAKFLAGRDDFAIDRSIDNKLLVSVAPSGYLRRVK